MTLPFRLYLITDPELTLNQTQYLLPALVEAGLEALQVRQKSLSPADLALHCHELRRSIAPSTRHPRWFLNDRADLALSLGFDGVQLREDSLTLAQQAPILRKKLQYGVSTHDHAGVAAAAAAGAQFVTFGPVFETPSKQHTGLPPQGLDRLAEAATMARTRRLPLLAIGGITPARVAACLAAGAWGVAVISAIWRAADPVRSLKRFTHALNAR